MLPLLRSGMSRAARCRWRSPPTRSRSRRPLFWGSLAGALFLAFWAALPVNRWLIARGKGHAVMHAHHAH